MNAMQIFGAVLKEARGQTPEVTLAVAAGVNIHRYKRWERGGDVPTHYELQKVLERLGHPRQEDELLRLLGEIAPPLPIPQTARAVTPAPISAAPAVLEEGAHFAALGEVLRAARGGAASPLCARWLDVPLPVYQAFEGGQALIPMESILQLFSRLGKGPDKALALWTDLSEAHPEAARGPLPAVPSGTGLAVHFSSEKGDWPTPPEIFDPLHARYRLERDVCASPENAKLPLFWTKEDDALSKPWGGRIWMNPPYGKGIGRWVQKAYEAAELGALVVCLLPARTDTAYWHDYVMKSAEIAFIRGRVTFEGASQGAPFPSAVVVFRQGMHVPFVRSWTPGGEG